ncbi:MAG: hypothetical protein IMZ63_03875 [Actinobacteria bacterium]|nr:hypothetical protein [Actinomycetota bacterium]
MFRTNEERIVKSLETIAECMVKSNEMAKEAMKKSQELYEANIAMINENTKTTNTKIEIFNPLRDDLIEST